ncbi:hypothetical protein ACFL24_02480 [Patescibacteria group bacterium]
MSGSQKEIIFYLDGKNFKQSPSGFVPFDETMINRGCSIFDAIQIYNGRFIDIDSHLERTYNNTKIFGASLKKTFSKKEFKNKLEDLTPVILKYFGNNILLKMEIIASKQSNVFLRVVPILNKWLDKKPSLVLIAIQYKYLLQNLKYCGRYAEPIILAELAKHQIDPEIEECLFYSKVKIETSMRNMALEATNSAFFVIDTQNRLWGATPPNVLPSTSYKIIEKIAKQDMHDSSIPDKNRISKIMKTGFPINTPGYQIKEMFSAGAVRSLVPIKKLIFVNVRSDKSKIIIERNSEISDIIVNEAPIVNRLRDRFQNEIKHFKYQG